VFSVIDIPREKIVVPVAGGADIPGNTVKEGEVQASGRGTMPSLRMKNHHTRLPVREAYGSALFP
jgi:hypothetical protein